MEVNRIFDAVAQAKKLVASAAFIEQNYGTYVDGRGKSIT